MGGGYDDYGYNYDKPGSKSQPYKPRTKVYSYSEEPSAAPPTPTHYTFSAGGPEYVSYKGKWSRRRHNMLGRTQVFWFQVTSLPTRAQRHDAPHPTDTEKIHTLPSDRRRIITA